MPVSTDAEQADTASGRTEADARRLMTTQSRFHHSGAAAQRKACTDRLHNAKRARTAQRKASPRSAHAPGRDAPPMDKASAYGARSKEAGGGVAE